MNMNFDELGLYYPATLAGFDGECFHYSVYFDIPVTQTLCDEIQNALDAFFEPFYENDDTYPGDIMVMNEDDMVQIELDLGNVKPESAFQNEVISGVLQGLNNVSGIQRVVVNENCDY
ncbi:MAG: hypothetical protein K6F80_03590 [Oscillospiraceae bacterium]|nr:hypothetical protein [Oscillospiraceae bacterium]